MGYTMDQQKSVFRIKNEDFQELIVTWIGETETNPTGHRVDLSTLKDRMFNDAPTVSEKMAELFDAYRWELDFDEENNISAIYFNGEKYWDDDNTLLKTIAPYVTDGSFIEMRGEDGEVWRWVYKNNAIETHYAELTFPTLETPVAEAVN